MILWDTILDRLSKQVEYDELRFIDIRYLTKWITNYPDCFPKFVLNGNFNIKFNSEKIRWELHRN